MKAKNILMTLLLVTGAIAAKAAGYPPELALVSQPVMVYNANSITVYYDVENIGDYTYRGSVYLYMDPDYGYYYASKRVTVRAGSIKRIAISVPANRVRKGHAFTIMPYYELDDELYSFTTFEYFEPITFYWEGPRTERWVVIHVGPCPRHYYRPGTYRYYYDGYRPHHDHGPGMPPPMDPKHHTYGYHKDHGGYPANHFNGGDAPKPHDGGGEAPKPHDSGSATVRPDGTAGSMSGGTSSGSGTGSSSGSVKPSAPTSGSSSGSGNSGRKPTSGSTSGSSSVSRPSSSSSSGTTSGSSRPSSGSNVSRPSGGSSSSSGTVSRPSSGSTRPSGTSSSSSSGRKGSSSTSSSSSSTTRPAATTSGSSSSSRGSSSGSGSSGGRR